MSHGDHVDAPPPGYVVDRVERQRADRRHAARDEADSLASSSIPKSRTRRAAARSSRTSSSASATPSRVGRRARSSRARSRRSEQLVGDARVICGLSGGVDSSVAAALVHRAIGDQLTCVFVDTGLLRLHEREQVERTFKREPRHQARHGRRVRDASSTRSRASTIRKRSGRSSATRSSTCSRTTDALREAGKDPIAATSSSCRERSIRT